MMNGFLSSGPGAALKYGGGTTALSPMLKDTITATQFQSSPLGQAIRETQIRQLRPSFVPRIPYAPYVRRLHPWFRILDILETGMELWWINEEGQSFYEMPAGWEHCCGTASPGPDGIGALVQYSSSGNPPGCGGSTATLCGTPGQPPTVPNTWNYGDPLPSRLGSTPAWRVWFGARTFVGAGSRMTLQEAWVRTTAPGNQPPPNPWPATQTPPKFTFVPDKPPLRPWRYWDLPYVPDVPGLRETYPPKSKTPRVIPQNPPPPEFPTPPPAGVKEKKVKPGGWTTALLNVWHGLTEFLDIFGALYTAMPMWWQIKHYERPLFQRYLQLAQDIMMIDPYQAIENILWNSLEDDLFGKVFKALDDAGIGISKSGQPYLK